MAEEQVFLQEAGVLVTSSRIELGGQTFATRNVGSVKLIAPGISMLAILLAVIGLAVMAGGSFIFGGCLAAVGAAWAWQTAVRRELRLMAGGGEVKALATNNGAWAERVREAIASAISVR